jgi:hypothetical protein
VIRPVLDGARVIRPASVLLAVTARVPVLERTTVRGPRRFWKHVAERAVAHSMMTQLGAAYADPKMVDILESNDHLRAQAVSKQSSRFELACASTDLKLSTRGAKQFHGRSCQTPE